MKNWFISLVTGVSLLAAGAVTAQTPITGDAARGKAAAGVCAACHGLDGSAPANPLWPKLSEQGGPYIVQQLQAFKSGERQDPLMTPQAAALTEQQMHDLAAYYASLQMRPNEADPTLVELGERIYQGGLADKGVAACAACHSPTGAGNPAAAYPRIGGQHAAYLTKALTEYRSGQRQTDVNRIMRDIAAKLSDQEIKAVASYAAGLYRR